MEVVSVNSGGPGFFKVMMEAPITTGDPPANPSWQVDYISIKQADLKPEIINITVKNTGIGSNFYHLYYYTSTNGAISLQATSEIKANASAASFLSALDGLYTLSRSKPTVSLKMYNGAKTLTVDPINAVYYEYSIIIYRWRDKTVATTVLPFTDPTFTSSVSISTVQNHSPPIQGTFKLFVGSNPVGLNNGITYSIPFNIYDGTLSSALNNIYQSNEIEVRQIMNTNYEDTIEFVIEYYGVT
jgi:hypothetical protein